MEPAKETGRPNEIAPPAVIELERETDPVPLSVKPPANEQVALEVMVRSPEFVTLIPPPLVVVTVLSIVKAAPVREMPEIVFVLRAPLKLVVPVPAS